MDSFLQYLILLLIALLFAKDYVPALLSKFFGVKVEDKEENPHQGQIDALERHASIANDEMGMVVKRLDTVDSRLSNIEKDVSFILGKLSKP